MITYIFLWLIAMIGFGALKYLADPTTLGDLVQTARSSGPGLSPPVGQGSLSTLPYIGGQ
jgi:hypothetical protein